VKGIDFLYTVMCVYKDTLCKDHMAEILPKPTLFDFGPPLNKDDMVVHPQIAPKK
jgi:hypothetical protein